PGSYITVTKGIFSIADPLGGPTREATYMLRSISGATSYYDTDGRLLQRGAFPGDQLQFYYAGPTPNKLSRIYCDNTKQKIDYLYTGDKITQVVDWVGRSWTYEYAANGTLAAFGPTSGSNSLPTARVVLSFTDGAPKLTQLQVIDPSNTSQFTSFSWDAAHNVKSVTQAGRTMNVLSPETRHDSSLRLVDEGGEFDPQDTWGRFNFPDSSQATFSADPFGNRTREERSVMGFNPATGQTGKIQTVYSWTTRDLNGQATGPNTRQQVNLMGYGSSQNSTAALPSNQYDNLGRLIETSYPDGTSERWGFEPSATANKPSTYIDRGNRVFFYSYQSGRFPTTVVMKALPDPWGAPLSGPTDPRLQTVSVTNYTYLHGRIKTITESDPNGNGGYGLGIEFYYDR
ncbi:MAG: hypothetical protein ACKO0N_07670, partial [Planctomycetota bacterium]